MRTRVMAAAAALVATGVLLVPGVAQAHHVYLDFAATGAKVPGGDPDATATGTIDFNHEQSMDLCIAATSANLGTIVSVAVVSKADSSVLVSFGTSLNTCIVTTDEVFEQLHDFSDQYRFLVTTQDFDEGAVASDFAERPPSTTTSSTTTSSSTSTTPTTAAPNRSANALTPAFTG